jgi:hypothetical protein
LTETESFLALQGEEIIAVIPWEEWFDEQQKDISNPHVALLPLHSDLRAKFNATAAWAYVLNMSGEPYGYHNMIFSWIDTLTDNYPPPLDAHLVHSFARHLLFKNLLHTVYCHVHLSL